MLGELAAVHRRQALLNGTPQPPFPNQRSGWVNLPSHRAGGAQTVMRCARKIGSPANPVFEHPNTLGLSTCSRKPNRLDLWSPQHGIKCAASSLVSVWRPTGFPYVAKLSEIAQKRREVPSLDGPSRTRTWALWRAAFQCATLRSTFTDANGRRNGAFLPKFGRRATLRKTPILSVRGQKPVESVNPKTSRKCQKCHLTLG